MKAADFITTNTNQRTWKYSETGLEDDCKKKQSVPVALIVQVVLNQVMYLNICMQKYYRCEQGHMYMLTKTTVC